MNNIKYSELGREPKEHGSKHHTKQKQFVNMELPCGCGWKPVTGFPKMSIHAMMRNVRVNPKPTSKVEPIKNGRPKYRDQNAESDRPHRVVIVMITSETSVNADGW